MTSAANLIEWLSSLPANAQVAVDDGGLTLVHVTRDTDPHDDTPAGAYYELGGIPLKDEDNADRWEEITTA